MDWRKDEAFTQHLIDRKERFLIPFDELIDGRNPYYNFPEIMDIDLGHVTVGENCFIGIGAIIRNSVSIGNYCVIGAGAVILENTSDFEVFASKGTTKLDISSDKFSL